MGKSLVATVIFGSNFYFWRNSGYFTSGNEISPLLHTWSLAVEEQFYLVFPIIIMFFARNVRHGTRRAIFGLAFLSFVACVGLQERRPEAMFYLAPFRMWELMAGALLTVTAIPVLRRQWLRDLASVTGLVLIVIAVLFIAPGRHFPGWIAAIPVVGTLAIIHAGTDGSSRVTRALSWGPLVWIGLVSYSLYLWHWPILVFTKYVYGGELSSLARLWLAAVALFLAYLSYRFVETPFRRRGPRDRFPVHRRTLFSVAAVAMLLLAVTGAAVTTQRGLEWRFPADVVALDRERDKEIPFAGCNDRRNFYEPSSGHLSIDRLCRIGAVGVDPKVILWGDSHALAWAPAVDLALRSAGVGGVLAIKSECAALLEMQDRLDGRCREFNDEVRGLLTRDGKIRYIVLAAAWLNYAVPSDPTRLYDASGRIAQWNFGALLDRSLADLSKDGLKIWLLGPVPQAPAEAPFRLALSRLHKAAAPQPTSAREFRASAAPFWNAVGALPSMANVTITDPADWLCDSASCKYEQAGVALYRDAVHLNTRGTAYLSEPFRQVLYSVIQ
jgi:peptidoglycan/LPS O-acetylase OafA/YrhL